MFPTTPPTAPLALSVPLLLSVFLAGFPDPATAQLRAPGPTEAQVERVDSIFQEWADPASPGAAVAVTRNGRTIFSQGYGSAQLEYRVPVTPTTPFHVASVSKQFTTFAVALLARDGLLSWDDQVRHHLPELPDLGHPISLRQLANHTSGIRDQWELLIQAGWSIDDVITREQILQLMALQQELNFEPGTEYLYSNMGYSLLAEVVERVSGVAFGSFLRERVFLPLGMHRTHVHLDHTRVVPGRAYSYAPAPNGGWRNAVLSYANQGATSLFTTVEDLARWMGELEEPLVGDAELFREMAEPARLSNGDTVPYGLGLGVAPYRGRPTQGHGGADAGFRTHLLHFPGERLGVVVFGNAASFNAASMARQVAEVFLDDWPEPREEPVLVPEPRVAVAQRVLDELVGEYRLAEGRIISVTRSGEELRARWEGGPESALVPESEDSFWAPALEGRARFLRDREGRVDELTVTRPDRSERGRRLLGEALSAEEMGAYEGAFYSPELDVVYRLQVGEGALTLQRPRQPAVELFPLDRDRFGSTHWGLTTLEFSRDASQGVDGFRVSGGRVRNLKFHRVTPVDGG